jgi:hypothetical protein
MILASGKESQFLGGIATKIAGEEHYVKSIMADYRRG